MDFDEFRRIVDQFPDLDHLHLQGLGEPTMHPRFFDMVRYGVAHGARVTTNTNATLLNERRAEACIESGLDTLHISIDGATAETYERIRRRAHFDRVVANIERVAAARARAHSTTPHLHMVSVVMRQNLEELPDLVRLAARFSMEELFVQHLAHDFAESTLPEHYRAMREYVDDQTLLAEDPHRVAHYFDAARAAAEECGIRLRLPRTEVREHPAGTPGRDRCDWPWTSAYVAYDGRAMPCCMVATPDRASFGSMTERSPLEVWEGTEYQSFRDALASDTPPEICATCSIYRGVF
jgi:radical SAM protein with 4Fe4S-binding SPASM domain